MDQRAEALGEWLRTLKDFDLPEYEQLPELDLYMDQVLSYLNKRLAPITPDNGEPTITSFMINNYVKADLITPPVAKKYTRDQIGYLIAISTVKQVLSMNDIKMLFAMDDTVSPEKDKLYSFFRDVHDEIIHSVQKQVMAKYDVVMRRYLEETDPEAAAHARETLRDNLGYIAMKLAIEAEINKVMADRIVRAITLSVQDEKAAEEIKAKAEAEAKAKEEAASKKHKK